MTRPRAATAAADLATASPETLSWLQSQLAGDDAAEALQEQAPNAAKPDSAAAPVFEKPQPDSAQRVDFFAEGKPQTLQEFEQFWLSAPGLDVIGPKRRVSPRGMHKAELMVLVVDPEEGDTQKLLSGPQGALLDRIFAAMGVDPS